MRIELTTDSFNAIMKTCKPFVSKGNTHQICTQIELSCDGENVTAAALDGVKLVTVTVPCVKESDIGKMIVPVIKPIGSSVRSVCITDTEKEITVETDESSQTFRKVAGEYVNYSHVFPPKDEPENVCWFDPKQLTTAFSTFSDKTVKIEYYGNMRGIVIYGHEKRASVLPVRPPKNGEQ